MLRINGVKTILAVILSLLPLSAVAQQTANLWIGANGGDRNVRLGQNATIDVIAGNFGPEAAENVVISIMPPPGVTAHVANYGCDESKLPIDCGMGTFVANGGRSLQLIETLPSALGTYTTTLSITSTTPDFGTLPKTYRTNVNVTEAPDLSLRLDAPLPQKFDPGTPLARTFIAKNNSAFDAHDLVIVFAPWLGLTMQSGTYGAFTCTASTNEARCTAPLIRAGETLTFTPDIHVASSSEGGRVAFNATLLFSEPDFAPQDNVAGFSGVAYRTFTVSNSADAGFGTLREALLQSATGCSYFVSPCKIAFAITEPTPASGWYTIEPQSPLPPVATDGLVIDGRTQTTFSGDTNPLGAEVELSGRRLKTGHGITLERGQGIELYGLAINGFPGYGIYVTAGGPAYLSVIIDGNSIGTDPTGNRGIPNFRGIGIFGGASVYMSNNNVSGNALSGIYIDSANRTVVQNNRIVNNGASGVFVGNAAVDTTIDSNDISSNRQFAVALAPQTKQSAVRRTTMRDNGNFAIDVALDLRTPNSANDNNRLPNTPQLTSARYDAVTDTTIVTGVLHNECNFCDLFIDLYASNSLAPNGAPQAERYLGSTQLGGYSITTNLFTFTTKGNLTGQLITASVTRSEIPRGLASGPSAMEEPQVWGTSELSDPITVK